MEDEPSGMETYRKMTIESPRTVVPKPAGETFALLTDVRNFKKLMPDTVAEFETPGDDTFMFALKGMPRITLRLSERYPYEKIVYEAADGNVPFTLTLHLNETAPATTEARFVFQGKFNTMMAMMIKNPITSFIGTLSKNMATL